jgi:hypothetical protein
VETFCQKPVAEVGADKTGGPGNEYSLFQSI